MSEIDRLSPAREIPLADRAADGFAADSSPGAAISSGGAPVSHEAHTFSLNHQIVDTLQTVLTALILAFIFRAYLIEAFIIPTGSMAGSLLGEHGTRTCPSCNWEYDFGPNGSTDASGQAFQSGITVRCPNCLQLTDLGSNEILPKAGDRILVHKWPFLIRGWLGPRRWDVIVFKDPHDPAQNFIKRLIALPNEQVQIVDGDVYICGAGETEFRIARKTRAAQSALWTVVFDQSRVPLEAQLAAEAAPWVRGLPLDDGPTGGWSGLQSRTIEFHPSEDAQPRSIRFSPTRITAYLQAVSEYNRNQPRLDGAPPLVGDVRLSAQVEWTSESAEMRWDITRDDRVYSATLRPRGILALRAQPVDRPHESFELCKVQAPSYPSRRRIAVAFEFVDRQVRLSIDGEELLCADADRHSLPLAEAIATTRVWPVQLRIEARGGSLALHHLRIDRDVHYVKLQTAQRAYSGAPFALGPGEYFVMGDNSSHSHDGREWEAPPAGKLGQHLRDRYQRGEYRIGTVAEDQIVGQAFFVYLPGLLSADPAGRWRTAPDLGRARFVR